MQHVFSSGEILYQQNKKELDEGNFTAETILYEDIMEDTEFICTGSVNGKKVRVRFHLSSGGAERVLFKKTMNILMQSDILQAKWDRYILDWVAPDETCR
jgi:hypothetical protein